jgi:hypothetical protein
VRTQRRRRQKEKEEQKEKNRTPERERSKFENLLSVFLSFFWVFIVIRTNYVRRTRQEEEVGFK